MVTAHTTRWHVALRLVVLRWEILGLIANIWVFGLLWCYRLIWCKLDSWVGNKFQRKFLGGGFGYLFMVSKIITRTRVTVDPVYQVRVTM